MALDIRRGLSSSNPSNGETPPRPPRIPPLLRDQKRLAPLVFGGVTAVVVFLAVIWYAIGLPGAPASVQRALGRLPSAPGPQTPAVPGGKGTPSLIAGISCGESYKRRPIGVMLGSDPIARPVSGFADADLVFELPVLVNNVTRHLAVYQCGKPREIGSIRSARHDYLFLAKGVDAVLAHWGGSYHALNRVRGERIAGLPVYETIDAVWNTAKGAYYRSAHLPAPYNGYSTYDNLWEALQANGYRTYSVFAGYSHTIEAPGPSRGTGGTLDIGWPGAMRVRYIYNPETNAYERHWGGVRQMDGVDGKPVEPKVLVVMNAEQRFEKGPGGYNDVDVEGSGPVEVYQNGEVIQGTWSKNETHKQDPLIFTTALGRPIAFVPGQIWIHVVDSTTQIQWTAGPAVPPEPSTGDTPRVLGG